MRLGTWSSRFGVAAIAGLLGAAAPAIGVPAASVVASTVNHAPFIGISHDNSVNWSGYAASGAKGSFTSVSASWVQPAGTCTSKSTYSAFWVGLDGDTSQTVEQDGSEVDCSGGSPIYYAWWEMYPGPSINFKNPVKPGDHFTASVTASGTTFTLNISDATQGWTRTVTKTSSAKKSSAEVIAEAPCCTAAGNILPLTDFGTVDFTAAMANGSPIGNSDPTKINMVAGNQGGTVGVSSDKTSALSGGTSFSDVWKSN